MKKITVVYGRDGDEDHQASIAECVNTKDREFLSAEEAESFISECTIVHNLDEIYGEVPLELMPDLNQEPIKA